MSRDSLLLLGGAIAYTLFTVLGALREQSQTWLASEAPASLEMKPAPSAGSSVVVQILFVIVGLILLLLGARWFVSRAVSQAKDLGLSDTVIGLTIVAIGTSLPEAATSI